MPKLTDLEVAAIIEQLRLLTESANKYIDDGSWIEALTDDIKNAKRMLKVYNKRLQAEAA
jgi:hypothetical protein